LLHYQLFIPVALEQWRVIHLVFDDGFAYPSPVGSKKDPGKITADTMRWRRKRCAVASEQIAITRLCPNAQSLRARARYRVEVSIRRRSSSPMNFVHFIGAIGLDRPALKFYPAILYDLAGLLRSL
jgi:hypothetical protein